MRIDWRLAWIHETPASAGFLCLGAVPLAPTFQGASARV